ncbi:MAG: hypothetical protein IPN29_05040 [Saprospiraceae bacterium]|nr:hypothetical protein [Saprospiraceae bacterium]
MSLELGGLISKASAYKNVVANTLKYRELWHSGLKPLVVSTFEEIILKTEIRAEVKIQDKIENLEAIVLDLGKSSSGISENIDDSGVKRTMIKSNGSLIYQQLFNGKIMVMIMSPHIEGYGEPKSPRMLEILRPDELKVPFILRHVETLFKEITEWEDYDDEEPSKTAIGFQPIGYNRTDEI